MTPDEIRSLRHAAGLTQQALAARMGVQRLAVARWEAATRRITVSHAKLLRRICAEAKHERQSDVS